MLKIIIAGSRTIKNKDFVFNALDKHFTNILANTDKENIKIVCGEASGPDLFGREWAENNGIGIIAMPADWEGHGKAAGYRRNVEMATIANSLVAFYDGNSKGTQHMIDIALEKCLKVKIIKVSKENLYGK